jgi:hypothetical protein
MLVSLNGLLPLNYRPLQYATISKIKSDKFKALQKRAQSDRFVADNALHAQLYLSSRLRLSLKGQSHEKVGISLGPN